MKKGLRVLSTALLLGVSIAGSLSLTSCNNKGDSTSNTTNNTNSGSNSGSNSNSNSNNSNSNGSNSNGSNSGSTNVDPTPVIEYWKVSFELNGANSQQNPISVVKGTTLTRPEDPTKEGNVFKGWYKDAALTEEFDFNTPITSDITLYAKWEVSVRKVSVKYYTYSTEALDSSKEVVIGSLLEKSEDPTNEGQTFVGWYTDKEFKNLFDFNRGVDDDLSLYGRWEDGVVDVIDSVSALEAYRKGSTSASKAILITDIDYEGYTGTIENTGKALLSGQTFDAEGHTIKNLSYAASGAKVGCLFSTVSGGTVKNVKFLNCAITSQAETVGIITGLCEGGTFENIEFNSCSAKTTNNYVGLIYGRNTSKGTITVNGLTTKNGCKTSCAQYGGFIVGDGVANTTLNFKNLDIAGDFSSTANGSFLFGRTRTDIKVSLEDSVIRDANVSAPAKTPLFVSADVASMNLKNVAVFKTNATSVSLSSKAPKAKTVTNCYSASDISLTDFAQTATNSVDWLKNTLLLDFTNAWKTEDLDSTKYLLRGASTNCKSPDATLVKISVNYANAKTRYHAGETFDSTGVVVSGIYSDGVQLILTKGVDYEIQSTEFADSKGTYQIKVIPTEDDSKFVNYSVSVVEQTGFKVSTEFADVTYLVGETYSNQNVIVWSSWSDGVDERVTAGYTIDSSAFNKDEAGEYQINVSWEGFDSVNYKVSVIDSKPIVSQNHVYINVDSESTLRNGAKVNGVETFKTISSAVDFLASCRYDNDVIKVINVKEGTYNEKIEIPSSLTNLHIVGESKDSTIITYSAVESTVDVRTNSTYGLDCATVVANADGFGLTNIQVRNDFNYIRDNLKESSPQGLALTINGDKAVLNNVHLYGNQDTLYLKKGRTYIKSSLVEGNIDFIFGNANGLAYFEESEIRAISKDGTGTTTNNGYVTAMKASESDAPTYGYIFDRCNFTNGENVAEGSMSLGRPWGKKASVAYINCSFSKAYSTLGYDGSTKSRWFDMSGNAPQDANFCEYGSTGEGAITEAVAGGKVLTAEEAANYTAANLFAKTNGLVSWGEDWSHTEALTKLQASAVGTTDENTTLTQDSETITIMVGEEANLGVYVTPWNAQNKEVTYTVSNTEVVSLTNGVVKALGAGTATITVTYGSVTKSVTITCEEEDTETAIVKDTILDFTTQEGLALVKANAKITYNATGERFNNGNTQFAGTIEIPVKAGTKVIVDAYDNSDYVSYTLGVKDAEDLETKTDDYTFVATTDSIVVYTGLSNNYINKITIDCPVEKSVSYAFGSKNSTEADYQNVVSSTKDITFTGNIGDHEDSVQLKEGAKISFTVPANATVSFKVFDSTYGRLLINGVDNNSQDSTVTVTEATEFVIEAVNVGTEESPNYSNSYLKGITIVLANYVKKDTTINFGEEGNYQNNALLNLGTASVRNNGKDNCQIKGTISLALKKGSKLKVNGYNGYTHYKIGAAGSELSEEITDIAYTYTATKDEIVQIEGLDNNYFYSLAVEMPKADVTYTYVYGEDVSSSFIIDTTQGTISSKDATAVVGVKLVPDTYMILNTESSTSATLNLKGFTIGSDKASAYLSIELLDSNDTVIKKVVATSGTGKVNAAWTVDGNETIVIDTDQAFTKIRFTSTTSGKSVTITEAQIVVKLQ